VTICFLRAFEPPIPREGVDAPTQLLECDSNSEPLLDLLVEFLKANAVA
jgi:hypothetical protein